MRRRVDEIKEECGWRNCSIWGCYGIILVEIYLSSGGIECRIGNN